MSSTFPQKPSSFGPGLFFFSLGSNPIVSLLDPAINDTQSKVFFEWVKVSIAVQQSIAIQQTTCRNDHIDGASNGNATRTKTPVVSRRFNGDTLTTKCDLFESPQHAPCLSKSSVFFEPAQHFGQDQVAYKQEFIAKVLV